MSSPEGFRDLTPLITPRSVAVVGASASAGKLGHTILKNILDAGFAGAVVPVNPKADAILGRPCAKSLDDLPDPVDLAVVIIPAGAVPEAIAACGRRGIPAAVVITGGFAESGEEGARLQAALAEAAGRHGVRLLGPNCQGINNPHHGLCASWPLLTARGALAVVSQSGTVGAALMDWAAEDGLGVSCFAALGNRAVVDEADLIAALGRDPHTRCIALYLEGIKDPAKFAAAARGCPVPLVALKPGRTPRGRAAAESHTRSLAGDDAIYAGFFRQHGVHRADDVEALYDAARALAYLPRPRGRRLLIVTSSGGCGVLAMDAAAVQGIETPPPPPAMAEALRAFLPPHCIIGNPLDLTGDATAAWYRRVAELAAPHYDAIAPIFGDPIPGAADAVGTAPTPCVICLGGGDVERAERRRLHARGIPVFSTPERGMRALAALLPATGVAGSRFTVPG
jgi:acetyltransferase